MIIAGVLVLGCALIGLLALRRTPGLTFRILSYETNNLNVITANVLVSNASMRVRAVIIPECGIGPHWLSPGKWAKYEILLPRRPHQIDMLSPVNYGTNYQRWLIQSIVGADVYTLEIPE